ncbi:MAG: insulinase family protein [Erythrobacter sp.]
MTFKSRLAATGILLALPNLFLAEALIAQSAAAIEPATDTADAAATAQSDPVWAFETSDVPVDPGFVFGQLENGMRYVLRENSTPEGTALVRLQFGSGSLSESESERGLAHFVEHMAFNGSTNIPEGEMIRLLEREGLAFGADTNASTGFDATTYMLNLPRNDESLLSTSLMIMRETASEVTIAPDAVERERGVILAERRDRRGFAQKATEDQLAFTAPDARFVNRLPIGTLDVLENASAADLRGFYERNYVPENAVLVIVGDFPVELMEAKIREYFDDWTGSSDPAEPITGPVDITRTGETDIYIDPALSESISISRFSAWEDRPDTVANRNAGLLRGIGFAIINRRLASLARGEDAPFRGASFGTGDVFEDARSTSISVGTVDGEWREGVVTAVREVRQAIAFGFTQAEVTEQIANIRTGLENGVASAATRNNAGFARAALRLVGSERIPTQPSYRLQRFEEFVPHITPEAVFEALKADLPSLAEPLIRFQGREAPEGGETALRTAWNEGLAAQIAAPQDTGEVRFAYTDFGAPGEIVSDTVDDRLGFRLIRFANGVRLTLKQTDIREERVQFSLSVDGGTLLDTADDPLRTAMVTVLAQGGLGEHSQDELQSVLAGKSVGLGISTRAESFRFAGGTTPRDLELQMQLLAAALTDPGYRREGEERYARNVENFFANLDATPGRALGNAIGGILSDNDPRFSLQPKDAYLGLSFAKLESDIGDRLRNGAIELALVGDFDADAAIAAVSASLGALPERESEFQTREDARYRTFTADRSLRELTHSGEADQALVRMIWPTTDDEDLAEALHLSLLGRVVQIKLQEQLREDLGQAYSPSAGSATSRIYHDYGTFAVTASVDVAEVEATRAAVRTMLTQLSAEPLDQDILDRARQPLLETYDNLLKSLGGWMSLANRAQSQSARLDRYFAAPDVLNAITPEDIRRSAQQYLEPSAAVEIVVRPRDSDQTLAAAE